MNWKKIFATIGAGAVAGSLGHYAGEMQSGHAVAFTFGNIALPALTTVASTLLALFVKRPQDPGK